MSRADEKTPATPSVAAPVQPEIEINGAAAAAAQQNKASAAAEVQADADMEVQKANELLNQLTMITAGLIASDALLKKPQVLQQLAIKARSVMQQVETLQSLVSCQPKLGFSSSIEQILGDKLKLDPKLVQGLAKFSDIKMDLKGLDQQAMSYSQLLDAAAARGQSIFARQPNNASSKAVVRAGGNPPNPAADIEPVAAGEDESTALVIAGGAK